VEEAQTSKAPIHVSNKTNAETRRKNPTSAPLREPLLICWGLQGRSRSRPQDHFHQPFGIGVESMKPIGTVRQIGDGGDEWLDFNRS